MKYTQVNNQQKKAWMKILKYILDQEKQSIDVNKSENPTGTLTMIFHKHAEEANTYVRFVYGPYKIC